MGTPLGLEYVLYSYVTWTPWVREQGLRFGASDSGFWMWDSGLGF